MSHITFAEYYDLVNREMNSFYQRIDTGETIYIADLERLLNLVNHVLSMLPVGTNQSDVPEDAYNQLHRIKEALKMTINNYYRAHPNELPLNEQTGGKKRNKRTLRRKKVIKKKRHKTRRNTKNNRKRNK